MPNIGTNEILIVAIVIVALIAIKKLPDIIRGTAKAIKEFKSASKE